MSRATRRVGAHSGLSLGGASGSSRNPSSTSANRKIPRRPLPDRLQAGTRPSSRAADNAETRPRKGLFRIGRALRNVRAWCVRNFRLSRVKHTTNVSGAARCAGPWLGRVSITAPPRTWVVATAQNDTLLREYVAYCTAQAQPLWGATRRLQDAAKPSPRLRQHAFREAPFWEAFAPPFSSATRGPIDA